MIDNDRFDELSQVVIRTDENVKFIKENILPPLINDVKKSREQSITSVGRINNLSKIVWWIMGIMATIVCAIGGTGISVQSDTFENGNQIKSNDISINSINKAIIELQKSQEMDRELYLTELRQLSGKVKLVDNNE